MKAVKRGVRASLTLERKFNGGNGYVENPDGECYAVPAEEFEKRYEADL
jgi:hypothetical protein